MKTGIGGLDEEVDEDAEERARRLMSLCVALVTNGGKSAATYADHAGRRNVVAKDILMCLQYQAKVFMEEVTDGEIQDAREDVDMACDAGSSSSVSEEEHSEQETEEKEWSKSMCSCKVCAGVNEAHETWDAWFPEDEVLLYLKNTTNKYIQLQNFSRV